MLVEASGSRTLAAVQNGRGPLAEDGLVSADEDQAAQASDAEHILFKERSELLAHCPGLVHASEPGLYSDRALEAFAGVLALGSQGLCLVDDGGVRRRGVHAAEVYSAALLVSEEGKHGVDGRVRGRVSGSARPTDA